MKRIVLTVVLSTLTLSVYAAGEYYPHEWINMGITDDMCTTQVVSWRTDAESASAVAQIAPAIPSPAVEKYAEDVEVESHLALVGDVCKCYHRAYFRNLEPGTQYLYRIGDGQDNWSEWYEFKTAGAQTDPFSFVYFADVQRGMMDAYPRNLRKAVSMAPDASFYVFTGDLTNDSSEEQICDFFKANGWSIAQRAVAPVPDNHDYTVQEDGKKHLNKYWHNIFCFPIVGDKTITYDLGTYAFDYQDCRFIMINTKAIWAYTEEEYVLFKEWVRSVAEGNTRHWLIACQHQPVRNLMIGRSPSQKMKELQAIYESAGVDMVLTGHDHIYGRTTTKTDSGKKTTPVYITSQSGLIAKEPAYHKFVDRMGSDLELFQVINVSAEGLDYNSYDATGELYDSFSIVRTRNGVKKFHDNAPDRQESTTMPERYITKYTPAEWARIDSLRLEYNKARGIK